MEALPMTRLSAILLLTLLCAACAGLDSMRPVGGATPPGITMLYQQKPDVVYQAALIALPRVGLHVAEIDPAKRYILAERGINAMSNGENVGLYFTPYQGGTQVTVASRRKMSTNVTAKDFAMPVHLQLGSVLGGMSKQP
ncbi:MAG: hypothetical protein CVU73_10015 [Deltaproteobacteria bacterium HGW-Deltaproteobacteria-8]|jgi:hypothetical protein|nr:MAG: hypothetical protein CVU73_10015 [Deltaproteobacteria bacterium HGW-Deltaproteobacteria-8]